MGLFKKLRKKRRISSIPTGVTKPFLLPLEKKKKVVLIGFIDALDDDKCNLLINIIDQINRNKDFNLDKYKEMTKTEKDDSISVTDTGIIEHEKENEIEIQDEWEIKLDAELDQEIESEETMKFTSEKENESRIRLYVDIANILHLDHDKNGQLKVINITKLIDTLKLQGFKPVLIADASIRHEVDDKAKYKKMVADNVIKEAPAGRAADIFILKRAKKKNCKFLTNDLYRDYYGKFDKDWIFTHRITCMIEDGEITID